MDRKKPLSDLDIAEEERLTFGRQSPYATSSAPSEIDASQTYNGDPIQPQGQSRPSEAPPPAYEEVAPLRGSQAPYNNNPRNRADSSDPSAPLLGGTTATPYNAAPSSSASSVSSDDNSSRSRRFSKFWLFLFLVIVLLFILSNGKNEREGERGGDVCERKTTYWRNLTDVSVSSRIEDFSVAMTGSTGHIIVEQATEEGSIPEATQFIIQVSATDRDDVNTIHHKLEQDILSGYLKASVMGADAGEDPECLRIVVRIIFPPTKAKVERLKLTVTEGNITVNLLDFSKGLSQTPRPAIKVKELYTRVVTGHSHIRADVSTEAKLGGSEGTIQGELLIGKELSTILVHGRIALNLAQTNGTVMDSKVEIRDGNIDIGFFSPYEGEFKLEAVNGQVGVIPDVNRTHLSHIGRNLIKGWNSIRPNGPRYPTSNLRLIGANSKVTLSLTPIDPQIICS